MSKKIKTVIIGSVLFNFTIFLAAFFLLENPKAFFNMNPHPMLFVVIIFTALYGSRKGWISTLITIIFYSLFYYRLDPNISKLTSHLYVFIYPVIFIVINIVLGRIINKHIDALEEMHLKLLRYRKEINRLKSKKEPTSQSKALTLEKKPDVFKEIKALDDIEEEVLEDFSDLDALPNFLEIFKDLNEEEILTESLGIFKKYTQFKQVLIFNYYPSDEFLRLKLSAGLFSNERNHSIDLSNREDLRDALNGQGFILSTVEKEGSLKAPITFGDQVTGLIVLKKYINSPIDEGTIHRAQSIYEQLIQGLNEGFGYGYEEINQYIGESQVLTFNSFKKRLAIEKKRYEDYDLEYFVFALRTDKDPLDLSMKIKGVIREMDSISYKDDIIYVLLPATNPIMEPFIKDKIFSRLGDDLESTNIDASILEL